MAQKRKRAPGAGRKPQGEFSGKTARLTMRMTPATRAHLEDARKKSGRSLSQEAEHHLSLSLSKVRIRDHIQALGEIIQLLAQRLESKTKKHWNKDVFAGEALRRGIDVLVSHFAPRGTPVTPISVEEAAAEMVGDAAEAYRSPIGLGETEAGQVMTWIEISNFRNLQEIESVHDELRKDVPGVWFPKKKWPLHKQIFDELRPGGKHLRKK
jgi:hypothetical protein